MAVRNIVLYAENEPEPPWGLLNPGIIETGNEQRDFDGCLSFPGLYAKTVRPHYLRVTGLDEWGQLFDHVFEGFDAVLVHHEIDHIEQPGWFFHKQFVVALAAEMLNLLNR